MLTQSTRNVAAAQLNPVAKTIDYKQLVSRSVAHITTMSETAYDFSNKFIFELIKALQLKDSYVQQRRKGEAQNKRKNNVEAWTWDSQELLRYKNILYVPEETSVREELLRRHHDDPLTRHFDVDKTLKLITRKYYWDSIKADVKSYVNTCDICQRVKMKRHRSHDELSALPQPSRP